MCQHRDSSQLLVMDLLFEWRVWSTVVMLESHICCRSGLNAHLPSFSDATLQQRCQTHSFRATIQPGFLSYQVEKNFYPGRKENPARLRPSTGSWHPCTNRTECKGSLFGHSLQSTEALRYICMFSHCCINYGCNTDGVSRINAWSTLSLMLLAISENLWHFLPGRMRKCVYLCTDGVRGSYGGLSEYIINPKMGFFFWHIL